MNIVIFGAGKLGIEAAKSYMDEGRKVEYFIDNNEAKWGTEILNTPIIGLEKYVELKEKYELVISCRSDYQNEIVGQLHKAGVNAFTIFDRNRIYKKERLISYSQESVLEDVILYHVLKGEDKIFYIDVGSNDPFKNSVTKLLYDMKNASGINIEPLRGLYEITKRERPRDINLCIGIGSKPGVMKLYQQGEMSTVIKENVWNEDCAFEEIQITTLAAVCQEYVKETNIHFLKVDVEGAEKDVLLGANFEKYRPWIVVMESTRPSTEEPNHDEWEDLLFNARYHYAGSKGVNRYYVADEKAELDEKFKDIDKIYQLYNIYSVAKF